MVTKKQQESEAEMVGQSVPSNSIPLIYSAMVAVMADIEAIAKTKKQGAGVSYAFRGIDDMMNAIHPVLVRHGVFIVPTSSDVKNEMYVTGKGSTVRAAVLTMWYRFYAADGSYIDACTSAESVDYSDKATQQAASYCYKDLLQKTFCIPTEDQSDGDDKQPDIQGAKKDIPKLADVQAKATETAKSKAADRAKEEVEAQVETMPVTGWDSVRTTLAQFNLDEQAFHHWTVKTLRANGLVVPDNMANLSKTSGGILWKIAKQCKQTGQLIHDIPKG